MPVTPRKYVFDFFENHFEEIPKRVKNRAVVVSFFGISSYDFEGYKLKGFRPLRPKRQDSSVGAMPVVHGFYDEQHNVFYLQVKGVLDIYNLVQTLNKLAVTLEDKGYLTTWAELYHEYAKALLFLFYISHIMVLCHPVPIFDLSYIHLFTALDSIRCRAQETLSVGLRDVLNLPKEVYDNGRTCSPRMLFRFDSCSRRVKDIKKLEHALEDQIYHILKKAKIVSNISSNSLFSIPANQEFVYVETESTRPGNNKKVLLQNLVNSCLNLSNGTSNLPPVDVLSFEYHIQKDTDGHNFDKFLAAHVEVALTKGFDDNVGKHLSPPPFSTLTPTQFNEMSRRSYFVLTTDTTGCVSKLGELLNVDLSFSEARCAKVLPLALATYQENSPLHYTREFHETRLAEAMAVLETHGRGLMVDKYSQQLEVECIKHWKNGRQMCQVLSLTGHPCTNAKHKGGGEGAGEGDLSPNEESSTDHLEVKEHGNQMRFLSACNCGRRQGTRSDPYTLRAANYDFYLLIATECGCDEFDSVKFPVFQPTTKDFRAAQLLGRRESALQKSEVCISTPQESFSLYVSGQSGTESDLLHESEVQIIQMCERENESSKDKSLVRQPSTTEYLPGMLHTESPAGLVPQFSSWSLLCLGPSSLYSHNLGLQDQPGLLPGSCYLLPWDVTVRLKHERKSPWSSVNEYRKPNVQMRLRKNKGDQSEFVVKIFVGVEYECPRGHRFMCAGPDKVLKTSNLGQVKDTGHKVTSTDMPLYFQCPCRVNKPLTAQLMRLHIVTPKAPVRVTLNPKVQPFAGGPTFIASHEQPLTLTQSAYWVLRLPFVYMGERGPFLPPHDITPHSQGRLLASCYGITEMPPDRN